MLPEDLQELCARGQDLLERRSYVEAELLLERARRDAMQQQDWDTLARLLMPLQEARRQRRQLTLQGVFCLDLVAQGPSDQIEGRHVIENYPHGTLLVAGWGTLEAGLQTRRLQARFRILVDVLLGAVYPLIGGGHAVVVVPHENVVLPEIRPRRLKEMASVMPHDSMIMREEDLPTGLMASSPQRIELIEGWWERLHGPFLRRARATEDPQRRVEAYSNVLRVDYACEFAHQELSDTARELARMQSR